MIENIILWNVENVKCFFRKLQIARLDKALLCIHPSYKLEQLIGRYLQISTETVI